MIYHRLKINDFNISTRSRFQNQSEMEEVEEVLRFKISLSNSKLKKIKPEISYEYFQDLTNKIENKFRLTTSINFDLKKGLNMKSITDYNLEQIILTILLFT